MPQRHRGTIKLGVSPRQSHVGFIPEPAEVCVISREEILITDSVINGAIASTGTHTEEESCHGKLEVGVY